MFSLFQETLFILDESVLRGGGRRVGGGVGGGRSGGGGGDQYSVRSLDVAL